jgi:hypothetical protein
MAGSMFKPDKIVHFSKGGHLVLTIQKLDKLLAEPFYKNKIKWFTQEWDKSSGLQMFNGMAGLA